MSEPVRLPLPPIPLKRVGEPSTPSVFCGRVQHHRAHLWDEVAEEFKYIPLSGEVSTAEMRFERHWCRGWGMGEGFL